MLKNYTLRKLAIIFYDDKHLNHLETANYFCEKILIFDRYDQVCQYIWAENYYAKKKDGEFSIMMVNDVLETIDLI